MIRILQSISRVAKGTIPTKLNHKHCFYRFSQFNNNIKYPNSIDKTKTNEGSNINQDKNTLNQQLDPDKNNTKTDNTKKFIVNNPTTGKKCAQF